MTALTNGAAPKAEHLHRSQAEYIWIDAFGELRSKTRTLRKPAESVDEVERWIFDGSSTGQADVHHSDLILDPVALCADPFRQRTAGNILVLCQVLNLDGSPGVRNTRAEASKEMLRPEVVAEKPWFGMEQEYSLWTQDNRPLGWPNHDFPAAQGPYYCGVGAGVVVGRDVCEEHYAACLYAGLDIDGCNAEVMLGQWEYQLGPSEGISLGDQLWLSRYILARVAEKFEVKVSYHPKPGGAEWNGSAGHMNFSTQSMREPGGLEHMKQAIRRLEPVHKEHIAAYGEHNHERLTGKHETQHIDRFSWGIGARDVSIRIPGHCHKHGRGYMEDRRPAANADPYVVTGLLVKHTCV